MIGIDERTGIALSTDGVGTKLLVAEELERWDTVGIDCVAMNVNDVICVGAEPLAMLDYIAVPSADPGVCEQIGVGLARGAELAGIEIPGGELAQLGSLVSSVDLSGACFGTVALEQIVDGSAVQPGDLVIGLPSSGIHSNGYTLARSALAGIALDDDPDGSLGRPLGEELLEPTEIYVKAIVELLRSEVEVRGLAHITSGGLGNLDRLAADVAYEIDDPLPVPPVFELIQERGGVSDEEMSEVFNMGCGFCVVVAPRRRGRGALPAGRPLPGGQAGRPGGGGRGRDRPPLSGRPRPAAEFLDGRPRPQYPQTSPRMDARPTSSMIGTVLSGRYRLEAKLGSGGMSTVYLAKDETLDRPVAVKVMHREMSEQEDQLERFRQEARAVAKISHPNVVSVIDAGEDGGYPYIVFEYVEGETLKQRISRVGALDIQEAIAYTIEIARGLSIAHGRNIVHRDIKPQNVLIDDEGRAKLTDFGISRQLEQDGMTATGRVLGTTDYVAPEQAMGHGADPRSDVYSLGVVLYEMLVGQVPFHADSQVGVAMKHVNEELPDVQRRRPEVSAAVALAVERSTAKSARGALPDVGEMIDDLSTALEVEAARAGSTTGEATSVLDAVPPPKRKLSSSARWSWGAIALLVLIGGGALLATKLISDGTFGGGGANAGKGHTLPISSATDYDPQGDGEEGAESVADAVDSNPTTTAWESRALRLRDLRRDQDRP